VRTQAERDEQTVDIAMAGVIFVGLLAAGVILLWLVGTLLDLGSGTVALLVWAIAATGAAVSVRYLVQRRRP
jgi:putative flippase GtrA